MAMMAYIVTSPRFVTPEGSTVTEDQLAGCNIAALVAAGHLTPVVTRSTGSAASTADMDAAKTELAEAEAHLAAAEESVNPDPATAGTTKE